jgi:hypothetical protein
MNSKDLQFLLCPYCASPFRKGNVWKTEKEQWRYASVVCECDEFPIVEGILYLHKPRHREVLDYLRTQQFPAALIICLTQKGKLHPKKLWMKYGGLQLAEFLLDKNFLRKLGKDWFTQFLSPFVAPHLLRYYFTRDASMDALLLAFPLGLFEQKKKVQKSLVWLDVGSGIFNMFSVFQSVSKSLKILSLEYDFFNLFVSAVFYPAEDFVAICGDGHFPQVTKAKHVDIVSYNDSLQCLKAPVPVVRQLTSQHWLKDESVVFFSGLAEHLFLPRDYDIFPIQRSSLIAAFPNAPIFLDNELLSQQIVQGKVDLKKISLAKSSKKSADFFRYSVLWSKKKTYPSQLSFEFLPKEIRNKAQEVWSEHPIIWKNKAY